MENEEKATTRNGEDDSPRDADRTEEENERKRRSSLSMLRLVAQVRRSSSKALRRSSTGAPQVDNESAPLSACKAHMPHRQVSGGAEKQTMSHDGWRAKQRKREDAESRSLVPRAGVRKRTGKRERGMSDLFMSPFMPQARQPQPTGRR
jgi:hypothetical protein